MKTDGEIQVNNLATQFDYTSAVAPSTNGYYRQVLNLACLRSNCPNADCDVARAYANPDCSSFTGSFAFEQGVFSQFATPPNQAQIQETAGMLTTVLQHNFC